MVHARLQGACRRNDIEFALNSLARRQQQRRICVENAALRQPVERQRQMLLRVASIGDHDAELVVNQTISRQGVKRHSIRHDAHHHRLTKRNDNRKPDGINRKQCQDDDALAIAQADPAIPLAIFFGVSGAVAPAVIE